MPVAAHLSQPPTLNPPDLPTARPTTNALREARHADRLAAMDTKKPLLPTQHDAVDTQPATMARKRKSTFQLAAAAVLLALFWLARTWSCDTEHTETHTKVPLEVHIMSVRFSSPPLPIRPVTNTPS
jgi:hypothetical protein